MSIFKELSASSDGLLLPDMITYNTLMGVFTASGMLERSLELLDEAKGKGLKPDVVTFRQAISPPLEVVEFPVFCVGCSLGVCVGCVCCVCRVVLGVFGVYCVWLGCVLRVGWVCVEWVLSDCWVSFECLLGVCCVYVGSMLILCRVSFECMFSVGWVRGVLRRRLMEHSECWAKSADAAGNSK